MRLSLVFVVFLIAACAFGASPGDARTPAGTQPSAVAGPGIPASPSAYMNDYTGLMPRDTAVRLNQLLQQFEKDTTHQFVVAVYREMNSPEPIEAYTLRVANAWGVGQSNKDNGVVLFVFVDDRQLYIQIGPGLADRLTSAAAKRIIDTRIVPRFRTGDYGAGIEAGVNAVIETVQKQ